MPNTSGAQSPELQKLAEKFRKDPTSKLFFPLAEEYAKIGLVDDAITLLRSGIKNHPDLLSARVALGKALLSKGREADARAEFEQVIAANPDNLMAHKRLAAIYLRVGDKPQALASCEAVLAIHSSDPEILKIREEVNRLPEPVVQPDGGADEATVKGHATSLDDAENEATVVDVTLVEPTLVGPVVVPPAEDPAELEPTTRMTIAPVDPVASGDHQPTTQPDSIEAVARPGSDEDQTNLADDELATISLADLYVAQGHYHKGVDIYRRVLERVPGHPDATAKLENALTLDRLLSPQRAGGDVLKQDIVQHVLSRQGEGTHEAPAEADEPEMALVGAGASGSRHATAIQRLEAWLARIAERRRV